MANSNMQIVFLPASNHDDTVSFVNNKTSVVHTNTYTIKMSQKNKNHLKMPFLQSDLYCCSPVA